MSGCSDTQGYWKAIWHSRKVVLCSRIAVLRERMFCVHSGAGEDDPAVVNH